MADLPGTASSLFWVEFHRGIQHPSHIDFERCPRVRPENLVNLDSCWVNNTVARYRKSAYQLPPRRILLDGLAQYVVEFE